MCDLYYLDQIREAVDDAKAAAQIEAEQDNTTVTEAVDAMRASLESMTETSAKISLDTSFAKVACVKDDVARERLVRYMGELHRRATTDTALCMDEDDV